MPFHSGLRRWWLRHNHRSCEASEATPLSNWKRRSRALGCLSTIAHSGPPPAMLWFKLERVGMTARGPQAEVHTAQTCDSRSSHRSQQLGKSIGRNGGEIGDDLKAIWTTLRRRRSLFGSTVGEARLSEHPLSTEPKRQFPRYEALIGPHFEGHRVLGHLFVFAS
jgi:hypothetical protein